MTRSAQPRHLVGRRIVAVDMRPFDAGGGRGTAHDPRITLDDGSVLSFVVRETEDGLYGVDVVRRRPRKA